MTWCVHIWQKAEEGEDKEKRANTSGGTFLMVSLKQWVVIRNSVSDEPAWAEMHLTSGDTAVGHMKRRSVTYTKIKVEGKGKKRTLARTQDTGHVTGKMPLMNYSWESSAAATTQLQVITSEVPAQVTWGECLKETEMAQI